MTLYQRVAYLHPHGVAEFINPQSTGGGPLGSGLFTTKRVWTYNTYAGPGIFNANKQGLLSFMAYDGNYNSDVYCDAGYRVITEANGTMSVMKFMEAMAHLCSYGVADEGLNHSNKLITAKSRPLELRCGHVCKFVIGCAPGVGITTRQVHLLNVTNTNSFDDGHVGVEAFSNGRWEFYDVANDIFFRDSEGEITDVRTTVQHFEHMQVSPLAPHRVGRNASGALGFVSVLYEQALGSDEAILQWCDRIYEVPGICTNTTTGAVTWGVPDHLLSYANQIKSYSPLWSVMTWNDWCNHFY